MSVLLTGAAGSIGTMLRQRLPGRGWSLRLFDRAPLDDAIQGDITDPDALDVALTAGPDPVTAIVHLAGQPTEGPWPTVRDANIEGLFQVFEAARRAGVPRVIWASSNHAVGFTPRPDSGELAADTPARPETLYGVSKVFGEALGRYYVDRYGMQVASLRIGSCFDRPTSVRALATWLSPDDCARLVDAALRAPDLDYSIVWGVSANTRRWWSLAAGEAIGYHPQDDAELYAPQLLAGGAEPEPSDDLVGGVFTEAAYGIDEINDRDS
jgi:uronate dehydrogenase